MAGIYLHIPFCKKACHYCNFHFSTQTADMQVFVDTLIQEIALQKSYIKEPIETIYFGGGTPSLLEEAQLKEILAAIDAHFEIADVIECTLEANPDDMHPSKIAAWKKIGINRLSIGIQSFQASALTWMNRAHTVEQSHAAIQMALDAGIDNLSIDLIYGTPSLSDQALMADLDWIAHYQIKHVSCYALTVEDKTALKKSIEKGQIENIDSEKQARHFEIVCARLKTMGLEHYEISNFAKPGFRSQHNSHYWSGETYLGLGPSAHSFNTISRQWNIANNALYIKSIAQGQLNFEIELLTEANRYNEYMMTSLRRIEGFDLDLIAAKFGNRYYEHSIAIINEMEPRNIFNQNGNQYSLKDEAKFLADGIASDFFILESAPSS
ncbi:MAG: radical SAM family heme chaperone HemW [Chitinophagaceae bacterium]|jgi:oxygen-independent coproporphyrinogen-3 oxidase|nr:radical SAM family heme chaperone HemW [Chitinophagaceae bacterium]MCF8289239.1 radical SAM family heme chaperone HemW [Chitinophagaceae bacterium]MCF8421655.1 radical SAM family heme chaperone HemW [Chitinophagaceae bacterium]